MAGNDVFLFSVPSDTNVNDARLRDPTQVTTPAFVLSGLEGPDTAAFSLQEGFRLSAVEGPDTAVLSVQEGFRLTGIEDADTVALFVQEGFRLAAIEGSDAASFAFDAVPVFGLAATESADQAFFDMQGDALAIVPLNLGAGGGSWVRTSDDGISTLKAHDVRLPGLRIGTPELAPHPVFKVQSVTLELRIGQPRIMRNDTNEILDLLALIDLIEQKAA